MTVKKAGSPALEVAGDDVLGGPVPTVLRGRTLDAPFADALVALGETREDVVVLSADLSKYTDLVPFRTKFPERFVQVGMAEQNMMGIAAGLAKSGFLPIAVTYGVFATRRAYDQVAIALATGMTGPAVVVAFLPGITTPFRATHQATDDLALMRAIPGMTVIDPCDATEQSAALAAAAAHDGPVYMRGLRGLVEQIFPEEGFAFTIGKARLIAEGSDGAIISTGLGTSWALDTREILEQAGASFAILNVPTLKPIDADAILAVAARHTCVYVIENHSTIGGLASAVSEVIASQGLPVRVVALGIPDVWAPAGSIDFVRAELGLTAEAMAARIMREGAAR